MYRYVKPAFTINGNPFENEIYYIRDMEGHVIAEYDGAGNLMAEYVYANGQRIAKMSPDGTIDYYLNDHLGSARAMAGSGWSANYYPFGEIASQTGSEEHTHFDFTGQERDHGTGLMYFGARYYDPAIGRFLSIDPLADNFPDVTPYHYTHNNPINRIDPTGMDDKDSNEDEEKKKDLLSVIVNTVKNYIAPDTKMSKEQAQEIEADKSKIQKNVEQSTNETLEVMETSQPYITVSVGKQTMGTGVQGSVTLTGDGVALSGGVDATAGYGIPVGISFGLIKRTDGQPASVNDLSNVGIGSTFGAGVGFEFVSSPDATAYNTGFVISPAIWGGGNVGYSFTKTFKFKNK